MNLQKSAFDSKDAQLIAKSLIEKKCSIESIDPMIHQMLLIPLSTYRNQAIFLNQQKRKQYIDEIISKLNLTPNCANQIKNQRKKKTMVNNTHKRPNQNHIKVNCQERKYINSIIDALLTDSEIATIDPTFIPKMLIVLKERKQKATVNKDFKTIKQIQKIISMLEKKKSEKENNDFSQQLINDFEKIFTKINQINQAYIAQIELMNKQKEDSINKLIESNFHEALEYEEEKESLGNGKGFLPSLALRELIRKSKCAKNVEENRHYQKQIEEMENREMFDYLQRTDKLLKIKKERLQKTFENREKLLEEQWKVKFNKLDIQYRNQMAQERKQLDSIRQKKKRLGIDPPLMEKYVSDETESAKFLLNRNSTSDKLSVWKLSAFSLNQANENYDLNTIENDEVFPSSNEVINGLDDEELNLGLDFFHITSSTDDDDEITMNESLESQGKEVHQANDSNHDITILFGKVPVPQLSINYSNSNSGSDLIIFSPDKDNTEIQFYTDDDSNQSLIKQNVLKDTSPILNDDKLFQLK